ncbi:MAG: hypothetical protein HXK96_01610 [Candidatus Nanogingivalaceae bacterium]|nr:hypothetical protein [Candidatus Nanogingivalaceae bacterium]
MALYVRQDDNRTELQEKIAAELREKQIKNSLGEGGSTPKNKKESPDIEDSTYLEGTKETTGLAFVWLLVFLAISIALGLYIWVASQRV